MEYPWKVQIMERQFESSETLDPPFYWWLKEEPLRIHRDLLETQHLKLIDSPLLGAIKKMVQNP